MESHSDTLENILKDRLLTSGEISTALKRASISGLLVMNPQNKGKIEQAEPFPKIAVLSYEQALYAVKEFYDVHGCKRCLMHYFDYPLFNEQTIRKVERKDLLKTHPAHEIYWLHMHLGSYQVLGGSLLYMPGDMPKINKIRKQIEKLQRAEDKLQMEENPSDTEVKGVYSINHQIVQELDMIMARAG